MPNLQHLEQELSGPKQKAIEDARKAQATILKECADADRDPPPYLLSELIGKGSFGRVYKASDTRTRPGRLVAVKIISIEEGDTFSPGAADTFNDILKEVNTLKLLSSSGARNINVVLDTVLVGQSVWIVTEYCAGGSVASLMRPTGGLPEKWIIPILREVAEAVYWVHRQGIIHRDIKCANVLVTDSGGVQLCDFGVAGIIETKFDKRSTVTGTLQWMAPELFDSSVSYGMEVDIWAFGSMAYEVASGLPPNATTHIDLDNFGKHLKQYCPRLEGDKYSEGLKSLVAFCLVDDPAKRPSIEEIQQHPYLAGTEEEYPIESLSKLVSAYKLWEAQGGIRRSLFSAGGAQGSAGLDEDEDGPTDEWVFDDGDDPYSLENSEDVRAVADAYGLNVATEKPAARGARRRRPPKNMPQFKGPLEKVFDANTLSNYRDNARAFYGRQDTPPSPKSDLPLRNLSQDSTVRESLINLDLDMDGDTLTRLNDAETIKPTGQKSLQIDIGDDARRKTQDWTFPAMTPAFETPQSDLYPSNVPFDIDTTPQPPRAYHSANVSIDHRISLTVPDLDPNPNRSSTLSLIDLDESIVPPPTISYASYPEPHALTIDTVSFTNPHRASNVSLIDLDASIPEETRPSTASSYNPTYTPSFDVAPNRASNLSLIDLDASIPSPDLTRPSTAGSQTTSPGSLTDTTPFDLEFEIQSYREPSMYVTDPHDLDALRHATPSPTSRPSSRAMRLRIPSPMSSSVVLPSRSSSLSRPAFSFSVSSGRSSSVASIVPPLPPLPSPPSATVLQGLGTREELKDELQSMIASLNEHLQHTAECLAAMPVRRLGEVR